MTHVACEFCVCSILIIPVLESNPFPMSPYLKYSSSVGGLLICHSHSFSSIIFLTIQQFFTFTFIFLFPLLIHSQHVSHFFPHHLLSKSRFELIISVNNNTSYYNPQGQKIDKKWEKNGKHKTAKFVFAFFLFFPK